MDMSKLKVFADNKLKDSKTKSCFWKVKHAQLDETFTVQHSNLFSSPRTEKKLTVERPVRKIQTEFIPFAEITEEQSGINGQIMYRGDDDDDYLDDDVDMKGRQGRQMYIGTDRSISQQGCNVATSRNCRNYKKHSGEIPTQSVESSRNVEDLVTKPIIQTQKNSLPKHKFICPKAPALLSPNVGRKFIDENSEFLFSSNLSLTQRITSPERKKQEQASMTLIDHKHRDTSVSPKDSPRNSAGKKSRSLNKSNSKHADSGFSTFHDDSSNLENGDSGKEVSILSMKNLQVFNESFMENTSLLNITDGLKSPDKQSVAEKNQKISCWLNEINAEKQGKTADGKHFSTERIYRKNSVGSIKLSKEEMQLLEPRNEVDFAEVELHKVPFSPGKPKLHKISSSSTCLLRSPEEELNRSIEKQNCRQTMLSRIPQVILDRPVIKKCVRKLNVAETFQQMKTCSAGDFLIMDKHESNVKHGHIPHRFKDTKIVSGKRCIGDIDDDCESHSHANGAKPCNGLDFRLPSKSRRVQSSKKQSLAEQHKRGYIPETFDHAVKEDILCSPIKCIVIPNDDKGLFYSVKGTLNMKENMPVHCNRSPTGKVQRISSFAEQFNQMKSPRARKMIQKCPDSGQRVDQPLLNTCRRSTLLNEGRNKFDDITTFDTDMTINDKEKQKQGNQQYQVFVHNYPEYGNSFNDSGDELDEREPCHEDDTFHIEKTQHYTDSHSHRNKVQMNSSDKYLVDEQRFEKNDKQYHYRKRSQNYKERRGHCEKNRQYGRNQWFPGPTGYQKEDESDSVHDAAKYLADGEGHFTFQQQSRSENPGDLISGLVVYEDRKIPNKQSGMKYKDQRYISDESINRTQRDYVEMDSNKNGTQDMVRDFKSPHRLNVACDKHKKSQKSWSPLSNRHFENASSHCIQVSNHAGPAFGQSESFSGRKNQSFHKQFVASVDDVENDDDESRSVQDNDDENGGEYFHPNIRRNTRNEDAKFVGNEFEKLRYNQDKFEDFLQQSEQAVERFLELRHGLVDGGKERQGSVNIRLDHHRLGDIRNSSIHVIQGKGVNRHSLENDHGEKERENKSEIRRVGNDQVKNQRSKANSMTPESHKHMKKDGTESFDSPTVNKEHRFDAFSPSVSMAKLQLNTPTGNRRRTSLDSVRSYSTSSGRTGIPNSLQRGSESTPQSELHKEFQVFRDRNDLSPASCRNRLSQKLSNRNQSQVLGNSNLLQDREIAEYDSDVDWKVRGHGQRLTLKSYPGYPGKESELCLQHNKEDFDCEGFISLDKLSKSTKKFRIKEGQFFETEDDKELSKSYMNVIHDLDDIDQASDDNLHETLNDTIKPYKQYYQKVVKKADQCESEKENTIKCFNNSKLNNVKTGTKDCVQSGKIKTVLSRKYPTIQSEVTMAARNKNSGLSTSKSVVKNLQTVARADHQVPMRDVRGLSRQGHFHAEANSKHFFQSTPVKTGSLLQLNETVSTIFGSEETEKQEEDEIILI